MDEISFQFLIRHFLRDKKSDELVPLFVLLGQNLSLSLTGKENMNFTFYLSFSSFKFRINTQNCLPQLNFDKTKTFGFVIKPKNGMRNAFKLKRIA
jgi:hypothetical protein